MRVSSTTAKRSIWLAALLTAWACGDDSGTSDEVTPADYDATSQAIVTTGPVRQITTWMVTSGPMTGDLKADQPGASDFTCDKTGSGSCPTMTVQCDVAKTVVSATLEYRETDSCKDSSGVSIKGTIELTRNAARDWTVTLKDLNRNGVIFNGKMGFTTSVGQPWSVTVTDLKVTGSLSGTNSDSSCTASCVKSETYTANYTMTFSTGTPLSVAVDAVTAKTLVINGSLSAAGTVTGHVKVVTLGPKGKSYDAVDKDFAASFQNRAVTFKDVTYPIPVSCTCPASGSLSSASLVGCGDMTVSFAKSTSGGCASSTVSYTSTDQKCQYTAKVAKLAIDETCLPVASK